VKKWPSKTGDRVVENAGLAEENPSTASQSAKSRLFATAGVQTCDLRHSTTPRSRPLSQTPLRIYLACLFLFIWRDRSSPRHSYFEFPITKSETYEDLFSQTNNISCCFLSRVISRFIYYVTLPGSRLEYPAFLYFCIL
jgi:hypothetical protein